MIVYLYIFLCFVLIGCEKQKTNWTPVDLDRSVWEKVDFKPKKKVIRNVCYKKTSGIVIDPSLKNGEISVFEYKSGHVKKIKKGKVLWSFKADLKGRHLIYEANRFTFIGDLSTFVYILDKYTGKLLRKEDIGGQLGGVISSKKDRIIISTTNQNIYAYDSQMNPVWTSEKKEFGKGIINSMHILSDNLIFLTFSGDIICLNIMNGEHIWSHITSERVDSFDIAYRDSVYIFRINDRVVFISLDGKVVLDKRFEGLKKTVIGYGDSMPMFLIFEDKILETFLFENKKGKSFIEKKYFNEHTREDQWFFSSLNNLCSINSDGKLYCYGDKGKVIIHDFKEKILEALDQTYSLPLLKTKDGFIRFLVN